MSYQMSPTYKDQAKIYRIYALTFGETLMGPVNFL